MKKWGYLILCTVVMLFAGVIYAWSILKAPLAEEFQFSSTILSVNYTLTFCFFCAGGVINGKIRNAISLRNRMLLAAIMILAGFFLASRMQSAFLLYVGYGIIGGFGIGLLYSNIISEMTLWFRERQGLCSGVLMMGFGASAMLLGNLLQRWMNMPEIGWRGTYLLLGILIGAAAIAAALVIKPLKADKSTDSEHTEISAIQIPPGKMLKTVSFWAIFLRSICTGCSGSVIINFSLELGLDIGASLAAATAVVGILSVCNGLGRLLFGFFFDLLGYKRTVWISNVLSLSGIVLNILSYQYSSVEIFVVGALITGLAYGSMPTISSAIVADFYGTKYFTQNFSIMNFTLVASSLVV